MEEREDEASVMRLILELLPGALESVEGEDLARDAEELRAGARAGAWTTRSILDHLTRLERRPGLSAQAFKYVAMAKACFRSEEDRRKFEEAVRGG